MSLKAWQEIVASKRDSSSWLLNCRAAIFGEVDELEDIIERKQRPDNRATAAIRHERKGGAHCGDEEGRRRQSEVPLRHIPV